jgi:capsular polysaccharide transport system permease protein
MATMSEARSSKSNGRNKGRRSRSLVALDGEDDRVIPLDLDMRSERSRGELEPRAERPGDLDLRTDADPLERADAEEERRRPFGAALPRLADSAFGVTSFVLAVVVPTVLTALFYMFLATSQFSTVAQFAVRGPAGAAGPADMLGLFATTASSETADTYIILSFIHSRDMIEEVDKKINLREIYDRPEADFYYRFDPTKPIEDFVDYMKTMVTTEFDTFAGVVTLTVRAFRPEDAQLVAENILAASERLVNELTRRARDDTLREARDEVAKSEQRLRLARAMIGSFRGTQSEIDPAAAAAAQQGVITQLEGQATSLQAQLNALQQTMSATAPPVLQLQSQLAAVQKQTELERQKVALERAGTTGTALTERLTKYEELVVEREFAERAYVSSLASLEGARVEADRKQRYLAVFVSPRPAEEALYPQGLRWIAVVFGVCLIVWGIFSIVIAGVRDHFV